MGLVHRQKPLDGLDLHDEALAEHAVETVAAVEPGTLVHNRDGTLTFKRQAAQRELMGQALFVRGLEQPRSEMAVHLQARANHLLGAIVKPSCLPGFL